MRERERENMEENMLESRRTRFDNTENRFMVNASTLSLQHTCRNVGSMYVYIYLCMYLYTCICMLDICYSRCRMKVSTLYVMYVRMYGYVQISRMRFLDDSNRSDGVV